jgi:hypothetical protein
MSKDKKRDNVVPMTTDTETPSVPVTDALAAIPAPSDPPTAAPPILRMAEEDRLALELAKSRRETALAQAKEALAKNETSDIAYKYVVLQLYMKYGLTPSDAISENGEIVKNGAVQQQPSRTQVR